jgi:hypothetical protein
MLDAAGLWDQFEKKLQYFAADPEVVWCDVVDTCTYPIIVQHKD